MTSSPHNNPPAGPAAPAGRDERLLGWHDTSSGFLATREFDATSVWITAQQDAKTQRAGRYVTASVAHPAKMLPAIAAHAVHHYTRPGEIVLDPMCGIGTTLVEAVRQGRHALGVEYEPQWTALARANLALARKVYPEALGRVVCADARDLPKVAHPAMADILEDVRHDETALRPDGLPPKMENPPVTLILTSPPYGSHTHGQVTAGVDGQPVGKSDFRYSPTRRGSGNLAHAGFGALLDGFEEILASSLTLLRPGGHVVLTTRPFRRNGDLVDLPTAAVLAAQRAGLTLIERNVALMAGLRDHQLVPRSSFFQLLAARQARADGVPQHVVVHEDVLVFQYQPQASVPAIVKGAPKVLAAEAVTDASGRKTVLDLATTA